MKSTIIIFISLLVGISSLMAQETKIRFFGQPGFEYMYHTKLNLGSPYFRSGPLVLYTTSQLNEKFSVAAEFHAHYMVTVGAEAEIERFYIKYDHSDNFSVRFGKMYTPIGYWNLNYNFGLILQPIISRPIMLQPTHDGGYINTRDVGLQIEGNNIGLARFFYKAFVFNGLGKNGGYLGIPYQLGETPGVCLQLGLEPTDGLKISVSGMYQKLQKNFSNQFGITFPEDLTTYLLSGSISYLNEEKKVEFISEIFNNTNYFKSVGNKHFLGGFTYIGFKATNKLIPYIYLDFEKFDYSDIFFEGENFATGKSYSNTLNTSIGLRYKYSSNVVFKSELVAVDKDIYGFYTGLKTQIAFVF